MLGVEPFRSQLVVADANADGAPSQTPPSPPVRHHFQSVVSFWGMFFYLLHFIVYATSICMWLFTDVYSTLAHPVGFMNSPISVAQSIMMHGIGVVQNSEFWVYKEIVLCVVDINNIYIFSASLYVILLVWHDLHNRMADLMIAAELHFVRLGVTHRQLDCHSHWQVRLLDGINFIGLIAFTWSITAFAMRNLVSWVTFWYRLILVASPSVCRIVFMTCLIQELMLLRRRFNLMNWVLEDLLAREERASKEMEVKRLEWID